MTITPQTNASLAEIASALLERDNFVIAGHISPDGDCLGSQLALMWTLRSVGKSATCVLASDASSIGASLMFLPGILEMIPAKDVSNAQCLIAVDVPNATRMGEEAARLHAGAAFTVTLDHHANPERVSDMAYVDPDSASASLIVWQLARELGAKREGNVAFCAYTGLVTDTGRFQFQNANSEAFTLAAEMVEAGADVAFVSNEVYQNRSLSSLRLETKALEHMKLLADGWLAITYVSLKDFEACEAQKSDADVLVETLRSISGVRVVCVLRETEENVRGSLRAKDNTDVAEYARAHEGGGHKAAAGMTLTCGIEQAFLDTQKELVQYCEDAWSK